MRLVETFTIFCNVLHISADFLILLETIWDFLQFCATFLDILALCETSEYDEVLKNLWLCENSKYEQVLWNCSESFYGFVSIYLTQCDFKRLLVRLFVVL